MTLLQNYVVRHIQSYTLSYKLRGGRSGAGRETPAVKRRGRSIAPVTAPQAQGLCEGRGAEWRVDGGRKAGPIPSKASPLLLIRGRVGGVKIAWLSPTWVG